LQLFKIVSSGVQAASGCLGGVEKECADFNTSAYRKTNEIAPALQALRHKPQPKHL